MGRGFFFLGGAAGRGGEVVFCFSSLFNLFPLPLA